MTASTSYDLRDQVRYELIHDVQADHWRWFFEAAELQDGDVVLDCGCGYGACTREIIERHPSSAFIIDLIDESAVQLTRARQELEEVIARGRQAGHASAESVLSFRQLRLGVGETIERRYDKILLKMVLHEVAQAGQADFINSLYQRLKPGGVLLIWDLALHETVAPFFRTAIRKKDELLEFRTMLERRHFLTEDEFCTVVGASRFSTAETIRLFDCDFYSERRIDCEFKGDVPKYREWLLFLREQLAGLPAKVSQSLRTVDRTQAPDLPQVKFIIQRGIWRLRRADSASLFNSVSLAHGTVPHLEPSSARPDLARHFQLAVQQGINAVGRHELLAGHRGLLRVTTFELKDKGRRELAKAGTDFIYSYSHNPDPLPSIFVGSLLAAYFGHIAFIYHQKKIRPTEDILSLTDFLNAAGQRRPDASWLRLKRLGHASRGTEEFQVTLRLEPEGDRTDTFHIEGLDAWCQTLAASYPADLTQLGTELPEGFATRIKCGPQAASIDLAAFEFVKKQPCLPEFHGRSRWEHHRFPTLPVLALLGFAAFMKRAGLQYAYYLLPPAPLDAPHGRNNPATVFFSSDTALTDAAEQTVLGFGSKMWGEVRGLELVSASTAFLNSAYKEEVLNRSTEKKFFVTEILLPLFCERTHELAVSTLIRKSPPQPTSDIFNEWAANHTAPFGYGNLGTLLKYLQMEREGISSCERDMLADIRHEIKVDDEGATVGTIAKQDLAGRIERARKKARAGGTLFDRIATMLEMAGRMLHDFGSEETAVALRRDIVRQLDELHGHSRMPIIELCRANQHAPGPDQEFYANDSDPDRFPPVRFRLSELQVAVSALRDNLETKNPASKYSLRYAEEIDSCRISWLEYLRDGPWDRTKFADLLMDSAQRRGIHRGLPRVLMFGFESGARKIEFLSGNTWLTLWPDRNGTASAGPGEKVFNYGFRFTI